MQWGDQADWLEDIAEGDDVPKALLDRPALEVHLQPAWDAFWALSGDRQLGFAAVGPITWTSIDAYARRYRIAGDAFDRLVRLVGLMDAEWRRITSGSNVDRTSSHMKVQTSPD